MVNLNFFKDYKFFILAFEFVLGVAILNYKKCKHNSNNNYLDDEVDLTAYLQQAETYLNGEKTYTKLIVIQSV